MVTTDAQERDRSGRTLPWPPPGLERIQGDLWRIAGRGALTGGLLVVPFLFAVARTRDVASLGPLADAWWVIVVLSTVGLAFAADALASTARLMRRTARALEAGHTLSAVARAAADRDRDMGFLLQGRRTFSVMERHERMGIARLRVAAAVSAALAGVWLPVVLGVGLLVAARGGVEPTTLWRLTVVPAAFLYVFGALFRSVEDGRVRRARKAWFTKPWTSGLNPDEIALWRVAMEGVEGERKPSVLRRLVNPTVLRWTGVVVTLLTVLVAVPILTLVPTSAVGPVLARIAIPRYGRAQTRAARAEAYRSYRVTPDSAVSPGEAGLLLQDVMYVGSDQAPAEGEKAPAERFQAPWISEGDTNPVGTEPHEWPETIFERVTEDPSPELMEYLEGIAAHPAQSAYGRLAHAPALDAAVGRWVDPFPPGLTLDRIPIPRVAGVREGSLARIAGAAYEMARGRPDAAEQEIREVISVGFLLGDDGPTLIDNLVGHVVVAMGGTALEHFYQAAGRVEEAARIRELAEAAGRSAERIHQTGPRSTAAFIRSLPELVQDTAAIRGLRWESFILTTTLTPCINLHRMVFGPGDEYRQFVDESRKALVKWPSEGPLFDLARAGHWGVNDGGGSGIVGRLLSISMHGGEGSCGNVMRRFQAITEVM